VPNIIYLVIAEGNTAVYYDHGWAQMAASQFPPGASKIIGLHNAEEIAVIYQGERPVKT
jgi:hypothetical protein